MNFEYFLLTEDDTCGLVFSNVVIVVLFNCMRDVWHLICVKHALIEIMDVMLFA
jgi:hypothetical protein